MKKIVYMILFINLSLGFLSGCSKGIPGLKVEMFEPGLKKSGFILTHNSKEQAALCYDLENKDFHAKVLVNGLDENGKLAQSGTIPVIITSIKAIQINKTDNGQLAAMKFFPWIASIPYKGSSEYMGMWVLGVLLSDSAEDEAGGVKFHFSSKSGKEMTLLISK
ncbi:MAG TPA: hypothetical protein PK514_04390 [Spirochaetota bacterium]|nr:hypothetical protein [Spirochaetota bacterium]